MAAKTAINCQSGDSHNTATIQPQYSHRELGRLGAKGNNLQGAGPPEGRSSGRKHYKVCGEKQGVTVAGGKA